MYCGTLTTKAPASMAMWRIETSQLSLSSAVGASQICGPPWYTRQRASGMRFSQQRSPPTRPMPGSSVTSRSLPASGAVEHALVHGGHQLAVAVQQALGSEEEEAVVERPGPVVLALVHADRQVHAPVGARLHEAVDQRAVDVDAGGPHPLPQLASPVDPRGRLRGPRAGRVEGHEALREDAPSDAPPSAASPSRAIALSTVASASRITGVACTARHSNRPELRQVARVVVQFSRRSRASAPPDGGSAGGSSTTRRCRRCRRAGAGARRGTGDGRPAVARRG